MNSLLQAISDLSLILIITLIFSIFLLGFGWYIDRRALKKQLKYVTRPERDEYQIQWRTNFWQGLSTEFIGAAMTAFLFGIILLIFQQYQSIENDKTDLILQMGSPDNAFAVEAARIAAQKGWLQDGTLNGVDLVDTNLQGAYLLHANLSEAIFWYANLSEAKLNYASLDKAYLHYTDLSKADLRYAYLYDSNLRYANLSEANLGNANLQLADLEHANLKRAILTSTNLSGAFLDYANLEWNNFGTSNLRGANLLGANIENVRWDIIHNNEPRVAILPDGTTWTPDTDMYKFTDPKHPEFQATLEKINEIREEMGIDPITA